MNILFDEFSFSHFFLSFLTRTDTYVYICLFFIFLILLYILYRAAYRFRYKYVSLYIYTLKRFLHHYHHQHHLSFFIFIFSASTEAFRTIFSHSNISLRHTNTLMQRIQTHYVGCRWYLLIFQGLFLTFLFLFFLVFPMRKTLHSFQFHDYTQYIRY